MNEKLRSQCELFAKNCEVLKKNIKMENDLIIHICASIFSGKGVIADGEKIADCKKLLKENQGVFSTFRGTIESLTICMLSLSDNPEEKLKNSTELFSLLKKEFSNTNALAALSLTLDDMVSDIEAENYIERGKAIYKLMKKEHPFLTSSEDAPFAVLLAFSEKSDDELIADMEECYELTKMPFDDSNSRQTLSHVLAFGEGTAKGRSEKLNSLYVSLKENGRKYSRYYELSTLGALSILPVDEDTLVSEILEADGFLAEQKGYGFFGIDKATRLSHAAMLVANIHSETGASVSEIAGISGVISRIAASQAAMVAIMAATTASAAAASASAAT